jgi:uncharacterized OsmC-like protein
MLEKKGTGLAFLSGPAPMLAGVIGIFGAVYLTVKYMANKKGYHRTSPRTLSVNPNDSVELPLIKVKKSIIQECFNFSFRWQKSLTIQRFSALDWKKVIV